MIDDDKKPCVSRDSYIYFYIYVDNERSIHKIGPVHLPNEWNMPAAKKNAHDNPINTFSQF